jgi:LCP family protein required for cell wall assembly
VRGLAAGALLLAGTIGAIGGWSAVRLSSISTRPAAFAAGGPERILILGYGGGNHPGAYLSDSMVLVSNDGGNSTAISIPRDLWVQLPPGSGRYARINEALQDGYNSGGLDAGGNLAAQKVQDVIGLPVTGWVLENFDGFRQMVDALGGVDVDVERAFSAQYPVNDNPDVDARWKVIHFDAGWQHMDGERALEYARARYADVPQEASDFARSARQQRLIAAIRDKAMSPAGALHFIPLVNALASGVHSNLPMTELATFVAGFHPDQARHVTLDSVVVDGTSADGQDILLPRNGNYALIADYVKKELGVS